MSSLSPAVILYDENGIAMAVQDGLAIPSNTSSLLLLGTDGIHARFVRVSSDGTLKIDPTGVTIQPISASELPLPNGAASEITLAALETILSAIRDTAGVKKIANALPVGDNGIGRIRLWDGTNLVNVVNDGGVFRLQVEAKLTSGGASQQIKIESGDGSGNVANVDSSKRLLVATPPPTPPVGTTPVNISEVSSISVLEDTITPITSGKTLIITRFAGGAEGGKASKVSLYEDVDGTGITLHLIRNAYISGNNFDFSLDVNFTGSGGRSIRMRRERLDGGAKEVSGFWDGYEV